ncbi:hypothetical protein K1719_006259 [Acacia pycnantha]|nr:hypothetical protein K1719_006259 [Acacia pycnantha]
MENDFFQLKRKYVTKLLVQSIGFKVSNICLSGGQSYSSYHLYDVRLYLVSSSKQQLELIYIALYLLIWEEASEIGNISTVLSNCDGVTFDKLGVKIDFLDSFSYC